MTYGEFETYILNYISDNWDTSLATPISEFLPVEQAETVNNTIEFTIGIESDEETFGTFEGGTKNLNIQSGTLNMLIKLGLQTGAEKGLEIIQAARALFHNEILNSGYIKFRGAMKRNFGTIDGKLVKLIVCPFTIEIIE